MKWRLTWVFLLVCGLSYGQENDYDKPKGLTDEQWQHVKEKNVGRAEELQVGDMAPDFDLPSLDESSRTRLAAFRGKRPVVLFFGSYT